MEQMLNNLITRLDTRFGGSFSFVENTERQTWDLYRDGEDTKFLVPSNGVIEYAVVELQMTTWQKVEDKIFKTWEMTFEALYDL